LKLQLAATGHVKERHTRDQGHQSKLQVRQVFFVTFVWLQNLCSFQRIPLLLLFHWASCTQSSKCFSYKQTEQATMQHQADLAVRNLTLRVSLKLTVSWSALVFK
jgi:hypothetical protein